MPTKILACNWKMNPNSKMIASELIKSYGEIKQKYPDTNLIVFPPSIYLDLFTQISSFDYGTQDISVYPNGAFTAQISAPMAVDIGSKYTLLGHSETREYMNYTDEVIAKKFLAAEKVNLKSILCIGYSKDKQDHQINWEELLEQLNGAIETLKDFSQTKKAKLTVAYEPVWAIGTGKVAANSLIEKVIVFIKSYLVERLGEDLAQTIPVLYGGSVNSKNIQELLQIGVLDGFLVGGASLNFEELNQMASILDKTRLTR